MATHDYVIANGTGAAVRADLNNALAAIVSNNSGSSEPGTTYAYQWWADTNANVLKLRNSANNAWITLRELDGTMLIEDGSASTPGLAFADDANTGIFSPAADQIGFATGGAERLEIGSSEVVFNDPSNDVDFRVESNGQTHMLFVDGGNNRIGVATTTPVEMLQVAGSVCGTSSSAGFTAGPARSFLDYDSSSSIGRFGVSSGADTSAESLAFYISADSSTGCSEAARIDSNGRLKVGGTGDPSNKNTITPKVLVDGSGVNGALQINRFTAPGGGGSQLLLSATRGSSATSYTAVQSGDGLGTIDFLGADGDEFVTAASIQASVSAAAGANDMPGKLVVKTTADGASSPTERVAIDHNGFVNIGAHTLPSSTPGVQIKGNGNLIFCVRGDTGEVLSFHANTSSKVGNIVANASSTTYNTSSDYRLKENVVNLSGAIDRVKQLLPKRFNFIVEPDTTVDGFLAHEAQTVVPEAITGTHNEVDDDDNPVYQGIDQSKLVPLLTAALQEAIAKIETLETKVAALEAG